MNDVYTALLPHSGLWKSTRTIPGQWQPFHFDCAGLVSPWIKCPKCRTPCCGLSPSYVCLIYQPLQESDTSWFIDLKTLWDITRWSITPLDVPKQAAEEEGPHIMLCLCIMFILQHVARLWQSRAVKKGRGKSRGGSLKTLNSAGTAIKAQLPDFTASLSRRKSMLIYGCHKSSCNCPTHKNVWLCTLMLAWLKCVGFNWLQYVHGS